METELCSARKYHMNDFVANMGKPGFTDPIREAEKVILYFSAHGNDESVGNLQFKNLLWGEPELFTNIKKFKQIARALPNSPETLVVTHACQSGYILTTKHYRKDPFPIITIDGFKNGLNLVENELQPKKTTGYFYSVADTVLRRTGLTTKHLHNLPRHDVGAYKA